VIESYEDLYETVTSVIDVYSKEEGAAEIVFGKNENGTCTMTNKQNGNKFVLMFARYGDEYKVGFAFYVTDAYGGKRNSPEWVQDSFSREFDDNFIRILIDDHLLNEYKTDW
jgi:hypothetical protein